MIFDGRAFAKEIEARVKAEVGKRASKPRIVSILTGDDPASMLYTKLKKEAAKRVGIQFDIYNLNNLSINQLNNGIKLIGEKPEVTGVMVQMPLLRPSFAKATAGRQGSGGQVRALSREDTLQVISAIPLRKDVDGLRWQESGVMPATVRAILSILENIANNQFPITNNQTNSNNLKTKFKTRAEFWQQKFVVIGSHGSVGKPLVHYLREKGVGKLTEVNSDTKNVSEILLSRGEVIISCVGKAGLIAEEMVSKEAITVDVGISRVEGRVVGDMTQGVYEKAAVAVPVPGGVGPVTVASLMENAVEL